MSQTRSEAILTVKRNNLESYKNVPSEGTGKIWGCFSTPKHLLVYGLVNTIYSLLVHDSDVTYRNIGLFHLISIHPPLRSIN